MLQSIKMLYFTKRFHKGANEMFKHIDYRTLDLNPMVHIGDDRMLITAGNEESYNTMTASCFGASRQA